MILLRNMKPLLITLSLAMLICCLGVACATTVYEADVCVYGATPGGITAAISAAREGASVVLLEQTKHVGGLSTSGLNRDEGEHMDRATQGGLCQHFTAEAARRSGSSTEAIRRGARKWQSKVAEQVFLDMLKKAEAYEHRRYS